MRSHQIFRRSDAEIPADVQRCDFAQGDLPNALFDAPFGAGRKFDFAKVDDGPYRHYALAAAGKTNRAQQAIRSEIVSRYHIPYVCLICEPIFRHRTKSAATFRHFIAKDR